MVEEGGLQVDRHDLGIQLGQKRKIDSRAEPDLERFPALFAAIAPKLADDPVAARAMKPSPGRVF
jgi:hypothetical protein